MESREKFDLDLEAVGLVIPKRSVRSLFLEYRRFERMVERLKGDEGFKTLQITDGVGVVTMKILSRYVEELVVKEDKEDKKVDITEEFIVWFKDIAGGGFSFTVELNHLLIAILSENDTIVSNMTVTGVNVLNQKTVTFKGEETVRLVDELFAKYIEGYERKIGKETTDWKQKYNEAFEMLKNLRKESKKGSGLCAEDFVNAEISNIENAIGKVTDYNDLKEFDSLIELTNDYLEAKKIELEPEFDFGVFYWEDFMRYKGVHFKELESFMIAMGVEYEFVGERVIQVNTEDSSLLDAFFNGKITAK